MEGPVMTYMRFKPTTRNQWEVTTPVKSKTPIANVRLRRNGECSTRITTDRALSGEELDSLSAFMQKTVCELSH